MQIGYKVGLLVVGPNDYGEILECDVTLLHGPWLHTQRSMRDCINRS